MKNLKIFTFPTTKDSGYLKPETVSIWVTKLGNPIGTNHLVYINFETIYLPEPAIQTTIFWSEICCTKISD